MRKALGKKGMTERIFAHVQVQKYTNASDLTSVSKFYHQIGMNASFSFPLLLSHITENDQQLVAGYDSNYNTD